MITFADMSRVETDNNVSGISPMDVVVIDPETGCEPIDGKGRPIYFLMVNAQTGHALAYDNDTKERVTIRKHFRLLLKTPPWPSGAAAKPPGDVTPATEPPLFGEVWKHTDSGARYNIVGLANVHDGAPTDMVQVIYKTPLGRLRATPLDAWMREYTLLKRYDPPG